MREPHKRDEPTAYIDAGSTLTIDTTGGCLECGSPSGHNATCSVSIRARNAEIKILRAALEPFASIHLAQDGNKRAEDMIDGPDLAITPEHVRAARRALGEP